MAVKIETANLTKQEGRSYSNIEPHMKLKKWIATTHMCRTSVKERKLHVPNMTKRHEKVQLPTKSIEV